MDTLKPFTTAPKVKKNMKNKLMTLFDKIMLRKRALIESVNDPVHFYVERPLLPSLTDCFGSLPVVR